MLLRSNCVFPGAEVLHVHMPLLEQCMRLLLTISCCRRCMCCCWGGVHDASDNQLLLQALSHAVAGEECMMMLLTVCCCRRCTCCCWEECMMLLLGGVHDAVANQLLLQVLPHAVGVEECMMLLLTICCCKHCTCCC